MPKTVVKRTGIRLLCSYRRFIQMFGNVVLGIDKAGFEHVLDDRKKKQRIKLDTEMIYK